MRLENLRDALTTKLTAAEQRQLRRILDEEGFGTPAEARKDEEVAIQLVDVVDEQGAPRYQLYLWPFGSGALFEHGGAEPVLSIVQHHVEGSGGAAEALREAWAEGRARLGLRESITFGGAGREAPPAPTGELEARLRAAAAMATPGQRRGALEAIVEEVFPRPKRTWVPYPKRRPADLDAAQRAVVAFLAGPDVGTLHVDLKFHGMFGRTPMNARFVSLAPPGPSDVEITAGGERLPLWCAVSRVSSGHLDHAEALAGFERLDPGAALEAWSEIARGDAYDLFEAHPLKMAEAGIPRTPTNVKHRTRFFSWMADASVALGEPGRAAAEALTRTPIRLDHLSGEPWAFIAILSLVRHGKRAKAVLDEAHDPLVVRLQGKHGVAFADPVLKEIHKALPSERLAKIEAARAERG